VQPSKNRARARQKGTENHPQSEQRMQEEDGRRECRIGQRLKLRAYLEFKATMDTQFLGKGGIRSFFASHCAG